MQMTYLDYLNTRAIDLPSVVPRIGVWTNVVVRNFEQLDLICEEEGTYGEISVISYLCIVELYSVTPCFLLFCNIFVSFPVVVVEGHKANPFP